MKQHLNKVIDAFRYAPTVDVNDLSDLSENVLDIVVEDGEKLLSAQLQSHLATNQRGFAIASISLTSATAVSGVYFALTQADIPVRPVPMIVFASGLVLSALFAVYSVRPAAFCFPGNDPKNWLPSTWPKGVTRTTKRAKIEKLQIIQSQVQKNRTMSFRKAVSQGLSFLTLALSLAAFMALSA